MTPIPFSIKRNQIKSNMKRINEEVAKGVTKLSHVPIETDLQSCILTTLISLPFTILFHFNKTCIAGS